MSGDKDFSKVVVIHPDDLNRIIEEKVQQAMLEVVPEAMKKSRQSEFLSSKEAKELLRVSSSTLQKLRDNNVLTYIQRGRNIIYPRESVERYITRHQVSGKY